jgi:hypothetical protein
MLTLMLVKWLSLQWLDYFWLLYPPPPNRVLMIYSQGMLRARTTGYLFFSCHLMHGAGVAQYQRPAYKTK